jgi:hypothetical protein
LQIATNHSRQDGTLHYFELQQRKADEATQLRIARRGPIAYLIARRSITDAPEIIGRLNVGEADITPSSLSTLIHTGGEGRETIVQLKSLKIHAEQFK